MRPRKKPTTKRARLSARYRNPTVVALKKIRKQIIPSRRQERQIPMESDCELCGSIHIVPTSKGVWECMDCGHIMGDDYESPREDDEGYWEA